MQPHQEHARRSGRPARTRPGSGRPARSRRVPAPLVHGAPRARRRRAHRRWRLAAAATGSHRPPEPAQSPLRRVPARDGTNCTARDRRYGTDVLSAGRRVYPAVRAGLPPRRTVRAHRRPAAGHRPPRGRARPRPAPPDAAGRHGQREDLHDGPDHRPPRQADAGPGPQQDAGRPAVLRVPRVLPGQRGRVLRQLLRLLPAGGVPPALGHVHREGQQPERGDRPAPPRGHPRAVRAPGRDHRRVGVVHLRPGRAGGLRRDGAAAPGRRAVPARRGPAPPGGPPVPAQRRRRSPAPGSASAATPWRSARPRPRSSSGSSSSATRWSGSRSWTR